MGMLVGDYNKMMDEKDIEKDIEKDMNGIKEDTNGIVKDMNGCERPHLWPFKLSVDGKNVDAALCVSSRIHPVNAKESIEPSIYNLCNQSIRRRAVCINDSILNKHLLTWNSISTSNVCKGRVCVRTA